jgi:CheY-like chemotaxis protein
MRNKSSIPILIADDDIDDCEMIKDAFVESRLVNELHFVHDGEALMAHLHKMWELSQSEKNQMPGLILLDLNMPKMDGREVLREMKKHPFLSRIPVIVLTTSKAEEDVMRSYNLGANSFITKPIEFDVLVQVMRDIGRYWFEIVELPDVHKGIK